MFVPADHGSFWQIKGSRELVPVHYQSSTRFRGDNRPFDPSIMSRRPTDCNIHGLDNFTVGSRIQSSCKKVAYACYDFQPLTFA